jgi:hydrogenase/urease accessory protein HupE
MLRALLSLLLLAAWPTTARADDLRPGYLEIREICAAPASDCPSAPARTAHLYAITWKAPIKPGLAARVVPTFPADCTATAAPERSVDSAALLARWSITCTKPLAGRSVRLTGIEGTPGDALLRYQSRDGTIQAARLTPAAPVATILAKPDKRQVARTYFATGVTHILMGYDHLLFVLGLVLLLNGGWRVAATVTAFTISHSLTLTTTTLNLISLPRAPVEAAIALSIVFLAVEIVKREPGSPRLSERSPWIVAFLFGLLHGFGFAGALAEIGLPQGEIPTALLTFNLGVEAGQLIIVGAAMAALWGLRKAKAEWLKPAQTVIAYAIGSVAAMWLLERVLVG